MRAAMSQIRTALGLAVAVSAAFEVEEVGVIARDDVR
jgi:hypothetical protein